MGNRPGGSRSKARENKNKRQHNYYNNDASANGANHYSNKRSYPSQQPNGYIPQHNQPYSNSYGQHNVAHVLGNTQAQYPTPQAQFYNNHNVSTNPKSNPSKMFYYHLYIKFNAA